MSCTATTCFKRDANLVFDKATLGEEMPPAKKPRISNNKETNVIDTHSTAPSKDKHEILKNQMENNSQINNIKYNTKIFKIPSISSITQHGKANGCKDNNNDNDNGNPKDGNVNNDLEEEKEDFDVNFNDENDYYKYYLNLESMKEAGKLIANNELVAFPTETVYGLGCNAFDTNAAKKIYIAKGRPSDNPLIVHISEKSQLKEWNIYPNNNNNKQNELYDKILNKLIDSFWPGPLSIIFNYQVTKNEKNNNNKNNNNENENVISSSVRAGLSTVAVRMPIHPIARALITLANKPIAAPSANRSGRPSPTYAKHVINDLNGRISAILDGDCDNNNDKESCKVGVESTVIKIKQNDDSDNIPEIVILRPGGVTKEMIDNVLNNNNKNENKIEIYYAKEIESINVIDPKSVKNENTNKKNNAKCNGNENEANEKESEKKNDNNNNNKIKEIDCNKLRVLNDSVFQPESPGMKYKHYAPSIPLYLIKEKNEKSIDMKSESSLFGQIIKYMNEKYPNKRIGLMLTQETFNQNKKYFENCNSNDNGNEKNGSSFNVLDIKILGSVKNMNEIASKLFYCLREFDNIEKDSNKCHVLFSEMMPYDGIGMAIMNRLTKAASCQIIYSINDLKNKFDL